MTITSIATAVAVKEVGATFTKLDVAYIHDPQSHKLSGKLRTLTETRLTELAIAVQMQKGGNRRAGADFIISGIGQEYMQAIRQLNSELLPVVSLFLVLLKLRHNQAL